MWLLELKVFFTVDVLKCKFENWDRENEALKERIIILVFDTFMSVF